MTNTAEKKELVITARQRRLIDTAVEIRQNEPEPDDKAFMTRYMVVRFIDF